MYVEVSSVCSLPAASSNHGLPWAGVAGKATRDDAVGAHLQCDSGTGVTWSADTRSIVVKRAAVVDGAGIAASAAISAVGATAVTAGARSIVIKWAAAVDDAAITAASAAISAAVATAADAGASTTAAAVVVTGASTACCWQGGGEPIEARSLFDALRRVDGARSTSGVSDARCERSRHSGVGPQPLLLGTASWNEDSSVTSEHEEEERDATV